jgi:hypothetical protein
MVFRALIFLTLLVICACKSGSEITSPVLLTLAVNEISSTSAKSGGHIYGDGNSPVTSRGIVWSTATDPTLENHIGIAKSEPGTGTFYAFLTNLDYMVRYYVRAYAMNSHGISYGDNVSFTTACEDIVIVHARGDVAPESKTVHYRTIKSSLTGEPKCWIIQNLGADFHAKAARDDSPEAAGWYWQFNRKQGYTDSLGIVLPQTHWDYFIDENTSWLAEQDPCALLLGSEWRMPTAEEWEIVHREGKWNSVDHTFNSELKLHAAGLLEPLSGEPVQRGVYGSYWSSSEFNRTYGKYLYFFGGSSTMYHYTYSNYTKSTGMSVRCLTDRLY